MVIRNILIAAFAFALFGCSPMSRWWGESNPQVSVIRVDLSGESCPELSLILKGDEEKSKASLNCWSEQLRGVWKSIQGKTAPDSLTEAEIATLIRKGIVKSPDDKETFARRIFSLKKVAGFGGSETPITREGMNSWLDWAERNRASMRSLYHKIILREGRTTYDDLVEGARISREALDRVHLHMESTELASHLLSILNPADRDIRDAFVPATDLAINVINMVCPTFKESDIWDSRSIGQCITEAAEHFRAGSAWAEFLFNSVDGLTEKDILAVSESVKALSPKVDQWFQRPGLGKVYPARMAELARRMGAMPPENLLDSLRVIRRLRGQSGASGLSTEEAIYPEAFPFIYGNLIRPSQLRILNALPYFLDAFKRGNCVKPQAKHWTECMPKNLEELAQRSPELDLATRVRNLHYADSSAPIDGHRFSKIMVFRSAADVIINAFHDEESADIISADLQSDRDNLVELISVSVRSVETLSQFYENVTRKLQNRSVLAKRRKGIDMSVWNLPGVARLVTMSSDLLVHRTPQEHNFFVKIISNLTNVFPKSQMKLDRNSITAILTTVDTLPALRRSYLRILAESEKNDRQGSSVLRLESAGVAQKDQTTDALLIRRDALIAKLPEFLKAEYPRAYESCLDFGYERSCQTAINALLPDAPGAPGLVHASDLDVVNIVASGLEGLMDTCDRNEDAMLGWKLLDGRDELDCGFTKAKDVVDRLLESQILKTEGGVDADRIRSILGFVNGTFITRITGKVAMARGTTQGMLINTLRFPRYPYATLGSIYGLLADIADPENARAAPR